eukprot:CAMPEP_0113894196 /NCGR_PEP_ID=MMETSP0780_2-20120614/16560_1 /TAXON_ID=652834 /ORGANISM="Palpitomonas bilix" /LENGTH=70 /DNA_ID=CAMNT_0000884663 /DNA_START=164 /DNA_END=376 /DNA_ORIENTATION=+ /assembly_acc=CAM_ASM_000599
MGNRQSRSTTSYIGGGGGGDGSGGGGLSNAYGSSGMADSQIHTGKNVGNQEYQAPQNHAGLMRAFAQLQN